MNQQPLNVVLDSIEKVYKISFSYDYDLATSTMRSCTIVWTDPIEKTCQNILDQSPFTFTIVDQENIQLIIGKKDLNNELIGQIIDDQTQKPISFVAISFDNGGGTETDSLGHFQFSSKTTNYLQLHRLGYETATIRIDSFNVNIPIRLIPAPTELGSVEIATNKPDIALQNVKGATELTQKLNVQNNASVFTDDPLRSVQLLPGVQAHDDLSSEVKIRGGDGDESLIILDGMTLYEAKHYYGIFSTINAGVVDKISVYKNHTPAEIEGRTSGVVDISTYPSKTSQKGFFDAQLGLMNVSANTLLSLNNDMSLMAGIRTTISNPGQSKFQSLLNPRVGERERRRDVTTTNLISDIPDYSFYDWNLKWTWAINDQIQIFTSTFHSHDETKLDYNRSFNINNNVNAVLLFEEDYDEVGEWNNDAYQIGIESEISEKINITNRVVLSNSNSSSSLISSYFRRVSMDSVLTGEYSNRIQNEISDLHFFSTLSLGRQSKNNQSNIFQTGLDVQIVDNQFGVEYGNRSQFAQQQNATTLSGFAAQQINIHNDIDLNVSGRLSYYTPTQKLYFSPQIAFRWNIDLSKSLKASFSAPAQMMQRAYFEDLTGREYTFWVNANGAQIPVSRAQKLMVGYQQISNNFKWDIEAYYKKTEGVIELASNQIGFNPNNFGINSNTTLRLFDGRSRTFGVDWLGVYQAGNYNGQLSYTLSKTEQSLTEIMRGIWFTSREDSRHQIKLSNSYKIGPITIQGLWVFASGKPYTDISKLIAMRQERTNIRPGDLQSRLPDFHRIDLSASYTLKQKAFDLYLNVGVLNILNRRNVKYTQYIFGQNAAIGNQSNTVAGTEWGLLDRTLNASIGARF